MHKMNAKSKLIFTSSVMALSLSGTGYGQEIALDTIYLDAEQEITTEVVLDESDIENISPTSTGDLFDGVSSVTTSGANPSTEKIYIHGIEESKMNVQVDGGSLPEGPFHHTGSSFIDVNLLKAVEVEPGVATADSGPNALAGSVKFETKDARDFLDQDDHFGGYLTLGYDSNGNSFNRGLTLFGQQGGFEYLLSGNMTSGDNYENGDGDEILGTEPALESLSAKLAYSTDSGHRFEVSANTIEEDAVRPNRPDFYSFVTSDEVELVDQEYGRQTYNFSYEDETPDGWWSPKANLSYSSIDVELSNGNGPAFISTLNGSLSNAFKLGNGTVNAGIDFYSDYRERTRDDEDDDGNALGTTTDYWEKSQNIGVFAQARQNITDKLRVSYGGRGDLQTIEGRLDSSSQQDILAEDTSYDASQSVSGLSGNLSVEYEVTNNFTLNAAVSSVFGGIAGTEALLLNDTTDLNYEELETSRSNNVRLGVDYNNGPWSAGVAVFKTELKDVSNTSGSNDTRTDYFDVVSEGYEINVGYTTQTTRISVDLTNSDVTNDGENDLFNYYNSTTVGTMIALNAHHVINENWAIGAQGTFALENDATISSQEEEDYAQPAYEVVDIYATYEPKQFSNLSLRFGVDNLFNENYANRANTGTGRASIEPFYDPGRSFTVQATLSF